MPRLTKYRCLNCKERFEVETLTPEDVKERERRQLPPGSPIRCPKCRRMDYELGWG